MQIKYVNFPKKENGKFGSIVMADGAKYMVPVRRLGLFRQGMDIEPQWETKIWGSDEVQVIKDDWAPEPLPNGAAPLPPRTPLPPPHTGPAPPRPAGNGWIPPNEVLITTSALMKSFIETGTFGLQDLPMLEEACVASAKRLRDAAK